jgi:hypothetical protein
VHRHVPHREAALAMVAALALSAEPDFGASRRPLAPGVSSQVLPHAPLAGNHPRIDATGSRAGADQRWFEEVSHSIAAEEYRASVNEAGLQAPNRAQGFRTYFHDDGITVTPRQAARENSAWRFGWRLARWGRPERMGAVESAAPVMGGARVTYQRPGLREWYENTAKGLEQGFEVGESPAGEGPLCLEGIVGEGLGARLDRRGGAVEFFDAHGTLVLRYTDLVVRDATGRDVPARLAVTHCTLTIEIDDAAATYPLLVDPLMTTPAWTADSDSVGAEFGISVGTAGDVNGDGFSDVIVGAQKFDIGETDEGRAFVYHGSAAGLSTSPAWTAEPDVDYSYFGYRVATAGDVNGDGFSDVIVSGNVDNPEDQEGRTYVYHGSAAGLEAAPAWTAEGNQPYAGFGASAATAGDVNGDGFSDVIVGAYTHSNGESLEGRAYVYHGTASGLEISPAWTAESDQVNAYFGASVASAGDVNGDGFSDVIVGAFFFTNGELHEGRAFVYHGSAAGLAPSPAWTGESNQQDACFGYSVSTAGDVNGDGFSDVIVGAFGYDFDVTDAGQAFVYHGGAGGLALAPAWIGRSYWAYANFGHAVATAGDVNGDGFADVVVGAFGYDDGEERAEGAAFVYPGSDAGLAFAPMWTTEGDQQDAFYGYSLGTAGDVNGDGYSDVIVGSYLFDNPETDEGRVFVYHGSAAGLATAHSWSAESDQAVAFLGWRTGASTAGDVNGDGYSDVIVGAPYFDNGQSDEGRAFVYHGSPAGLSLTPDWTAEPDEVNAAFGISVAGAGDVNGDGYSDVIVGAEAATNGESGEGRIYVYLGSPDGLATTPAWTVESDQAGALFGNPVATAGDVNGDGFSDVVVGAREYDNGQTNEGRAFVYHGSPDGLAPAPAWTAESGQAFAAFGFSVATAGDVNGDGFSDVAVSAEQFDDGQDQEGRAYLYLGSETGLADTPEWTAEMNQVGAGFFLTVATAGDVNGDGFSDLILGAQQYDNGQSDEGIVFVYHGGSAGLPPLPSWMAQSDQVGAHFGFSVAAAGDVNGDAYSDVVVSAIGYENGQTNEGRALVYHGSATGLADTPAWAVESNQIGAELGTAVASAGDVNGDGFCDVLVGVHGYDGGQTDEGRALLYYGNDGDGLDRIPRQARVDDTAPIDVLGLSDHPTSFRIKALGRTPAGRGRVRIEYEIEPYRTPFDGEEIGEGPFFDTGAPGPSGSAVAIGQHPGGLDPGALYCWRLRVATDSPFFPRSPWLTLPYNAASEADVRTAPPPTAIGDAGEAPAPRARLLEDGIPNPFRSETQLAYNLPQGGSHRLGVYDVQGRLIVLIAEGVQPAGRHTLRWDGRDRDGRRLPAGTYFIRLEQADRIEARKVVVAR